MLRLPKPVKLLFAPVLLLLCLLGFVMMVVGEQKEET